MNKNRLFTLFLVVALLLGSLAGCSAPSGSTAAGDLKSESWYDGVYDSVEESVAAGEESPSAAQNQKLIRTMDLETETNDLDALIARLDERIAEMGGYVEDRNVRNGSVYSGRSYRYADLTVRIPVDRLDAFVEHIQGASNVVEYRESAEDVTLSYVATESRITALETEQTRLLELLAKAENMSDLLLIEERLTEVRTELEEVTSRLRLYDNLVDYGTIRLSITEVQEFTPVEEETVWQRIAGGFMNSLRSLGTGLTELFIFIVINIPYILFLGAVAGVILFIIFAGKGKNKKKNTQNPQQQ